MKLSTMALSTRLKSKIANTGFTLVELMITVAVVGILSAVAYPSYARFSQEARRSDAVTDIARYLNQAELHYNANRRYPQNLQQMGMAANTVQSSNGFYNIQIVNCPGGLNRAACIRFRATARTGTSQANDTDCYRFFMDTRGVKRAVKHPNVTNTAECWQS